MSLDYYSHLGYTVIVNNNHIDNKGGDKLFNVTEFRVALVRGKISQGKLAKKINLTPQALCNRMARKIPFRLDEVDAICNILGLDAKTRDSIFFASQCE